MAQAAEHARTRRAHAERSCGRAADCLRQLRRRATEARARDFATTPGYPALRERLAAHAARFSAPTSSRASTRPAESLPRPRAVVLDLSLTGIAARAFGRSKPTSMELWA